MGWIVLPIKSPEMCKTRLRDLLTDAGRQTLVTTMLRHVIGVAGGIDGVDLLLLGPSRHDQPDSIPLLPDSGDNLNDALASAMQAAVAAGVDRLTFVSPDLPFLTPTDLVTLLEAPADNVVIAPDRWGTGTNALSLPLPRAAAFGFCYGTRSFERHCAEAKRLGLPTTEIRTPGFGWDIDTPEDLAALHSRK